jgi:prophage regulatory protein
MSKKTQLPEWTASIDRLIPMPEVRALTSLSKATIYRKVSERTFPAPVRIGKSRVAWRQTSIAKWMDAQVQTVSATE